ncbi:SAM-dependent methyltransferase [Actinoplanes sp. SE50]|uniref:class I SAM-dependent methyltransferase n=1 Tax=unclassified Actinoplanes TaxID=2626549 RepID=UPI00023EC648|nr:MULTISPECIES: class I SAM-dependent methyltransferase [unclassified Actinoplanes]AEV85296.1 methyltransferase type 12 [Actinoplanes sp. SE50/110]ATO83691.1 SAM-dependent methyltransferase [Actinoplanes sp. SE50]SLM01099.1 SAM-dependent methyltransferase [Actinoplanes sp. SE50/110]
MTVPDPTDTRRYAAQSLAAGDATGWFERLYRDARAGRAVVPWDVAAASVSLREFPLPPGDGRAALVVGCGPGRDAEHLAALGYAVTAFDISATAIDLARQRHPGSSVDYRVADLLDPPASWRRAFALVLESNNVQALPAQIRARAIGAVGGFVADGGTLLVLAAAATDDPAAGPPWPLSRAEIGAFAAPGLREVSVEELATPGSRLPARWRAVFTR